MFLKNDSSRHLIDSAKIVSKTLQSYSLPKGWQIGVAFATIISSLAVIVYIIQLIVTRQQFAKQIDFQTKQQKKNENDFISVNQGYLAFDIGFRPLTDKVLTGTPYSSINNYNGFTMIGVLKNVGRTPVVCVVETSIIYFNGVEKFHNVKNEQSLNPVYFEQVIQIDLGGTTFETTKNHLNINEIRGLNISGFISIKYKDFNSEKSKQIERKFNLIWEDSAIIATQTKINDLI